MYTIYYLVHWESKRRLRPYKTLGGARIACRLRNQHLGFKQRRDRMMIDNYAENTYWEYELYTVDGDPFTRGTYCIERARVSTVEGLFTELGATNDKAQ